METLVFTPKEIRAGADGRTVAGVAVPYGQTAIGTKGTETVVPGAFTRTLQHWRDSGRRLKLYRSHDHGAPVGVIELVEDTPGGLLIEARMADTNAGDEALREVLAGMLDSFSIGFTAKREAMVAGIRELREVALHEVSLVALPAYDGAVVTEVRDAPKVDLSRYMPPDLPRDVADWC